MHTKFDHKAIENKWQAKWVVDGVYKTTESDKPKCYILDMFPYPSGEGLHVGHPKGYIATDIYSRFKRMTGHEVLHPMGWDAFGLPAENFAIKHKIHPRAAVDTNVQRFKEQLEVLGLDYDWDREVNTTDPAFYKWTQWIFIQLLKKGLAYQSHEPINWCPGCQTGLANEDLESDGTCERCDSVVEKKPMRQWVLKIREYADRMLEDLDTLAWPNHIKEAQRNWIGRSEGAEIDFSLSFGDAKETVTVFTTRPDTLYGATYMVLAPEHDIVAHHRKHITNWPEVESYITETKNKAEMDRLNDTKEKTGVRLEGVTAINPANGEEIPVYIADYVLASYGTGAIMAVPAHDERDYAFAKKFGIDVRQVVEPSPKKPVKAIGAILKTTEGKFLFQKRTADAPTGAGKLGLFGGTMEGGELMKQTLVRELEEELELCVSEEDIKTLYYTDSQSEPTKALAVCFVDGVDESSLVLHEGEAIVSVDNFSEIADNERAHVWEGVDETIVDVVCSELGNVINSGDFDGLDSEEAKIKIVEKVGGRMTKTYKIKDWVFSRQRYWGEPIPVVHTEDGTVYPIAPEQLPVTLPEVEHYEPAGDGQSPLANIKDWVNVNGYVTKDGDFVVLEAGQTAPEGMEVIAATRETNTMPQWAGSSWYYLRFMDPQNADALVAPETEKYWAPVDVYVGGDHAVRHLIYARFWHKFLYDIGVVSTIEPFQRLEFLGFILAEDGRKMSKRWGNVINPDDVVAQVGADTMRVYEMFMGPFENTIAWSTDGLVGARRFLERVNGLHEHINESDKESNAVTSAFHQMIKKISDDIEKFKFNTAISTMMTFINLAEKEQISSQTYVDFLKLLAPFAPHLTEELWAAASNKTSIHLEVFPDYDESLAVVSEVEIGVQINGKHRGSVTVGMDASEASVLALVQADEGFKKRLEEGEVTKVIYVPGRIINIVVKS